MTNGTVLTRDFFFFLHYFIFGITIWKCLGLHMQLVLWSAISTHIPVFEGIQDKCDPCNSFYTAERN